MDRIKKILAALLSGLMLFSLLSCDSFSDNFKRGETQSGMIRAISLDLIDKYVSALDSFRKEKGYYPVCNSIYVCDEIKPYLEIDPVYLSCKDTSSFDLKNPKCAEYSITCGTFKRIIRYTCLDSMHYKLLYYGFNGIPESGQGDDILIRK